MKEGIHPEYGPATIVCSCGNQIETRSTQDEIHVEICAVCHPFYTGKQRLVDTAGRVERFKQKYGSGAKVPDLEEADESAAEEEADEPAAEEEAETVGAAAPAKIGGGEEAEAPEEAEPEEKQEAGAEAEA